MNRAAWTPPSADELQAVRAEWDRLWPTLQDGMTITWGRRRYVVVMAPHPRDETCYLRNVDMPEGSMMPISEVDRHGSEGARMGIGVVEMRRRKRAEWDARASAP